MSAVLAPWLVASLTIFNHLWQIFSGIGPWVEQKGEVEILGGRVILNIEPLSGLVRQGMHECPQREQNVRWNERWQVTITYFTGHSITRSLRLFAHTSDRSFGTLHSLASQHSASLCLLRLFAQFMASLTQFAHFLLGWLKSMNIC